VKKNFFNERGKVAFTVCFINYVTIGIAVKNIQDVYHALAL